MIEIWPVDLPATQTARKKGRLVARLSGHQCSRRNPQPDRVHEAGAPATVFHADRYDLSTVIECLIRD